MAVTHVKTPSALCEVHPQLRLANLYVRMAHEGALNALIQADCVTLYTESRRVRIQFSQTQAQLVDSSHIQPTLFPPEYVHLRMPCGVLGSKASGSEFVEVIDFAPLTSGFTSPAKMHIPTPKERYRIQCVECEAVLIPEVQFERVLPLPRTSWSEAASDWYCHVHVGEGESNPHPEIPCRPTDCLYGSSFHALAAKLFPEGALESGNSKVWHCSRCQSSVGLASDGLVNLWCHSVRWLTWGDQSNWVDIRVPTPLEAFYFALYDALEEEKSFFGRKLSFQDPSSRNALLLWFVGDNGFVLETIGCPDNDDGDVAVLQMHPSRLHRVLYRQNCSDPSKKSKLSDISEYYASLEMLNSVTQVLQQSSERLPPSSRSAAGHTIGYLPLAS